MAATIELPLAAAARERKIWLNRVSREFPNGSGKTRALQNIELEVRAGEFVCIVGPSGCGKSTLLHLIAGLDQPSEGEIWLEGRRIEGPGSDRILIFQELGLFPWLTVRQNVEFGMRMKKLSRRERQERARHYLRVVHLSHFEDSYLHQLSGGMKQRVALARALAIQPDVLLMDEPFAALDAQTRDLLHDELERIWSTTEQTILFVTHNVREAVRLGDRVLLLSYGPGRIMNEFSIPLTRPRHIEDVEVALTAKNILAQLREEIDKSVRAAYHDE
ncbi:MAG TPA: ABC transporter ATP-binding protein [Candidatus Dormibacteraeota bacterium]|nr:ABC transporter ATP-binding protein [Candidatus Dormibacteraeota bacterium]